MAWDGLGLAAMVFAFFWAVRLRGRVGTASEPARAGQPCQKAGKVMQKAHRRLTTNCLGGGSTMNCHTMPKKTVRPLSSEFREPFRLLCQFPQHVKNLNPGLVGGCWVAGGTPSVIGFPRERGPNLGGQFLQQCAASGCGVRL